MWELLKRIIELKLAPDSPLFNARNHFLASYKKYGMNFTDMAYLTNADVNDGRFLNRRKKTNKIYDIKITQGLERILNFYSSQNKSDFLLPILKRSNPAEQEKDIMWVRKRYNKKLKQLGAEVGIEQNLTSYVSRRSRHKP